jgi:hypothetical protein
MAFGVKSPKKHQLSCDVVHGLSPMISSLSKDRLATFHECVGLGGSNDLFPSPINQIPSHPAIHRSPLVVHAM